MPISLKASETTIQRSILDGLKWLGYLVWREQPTPVPIRRGKAIVGLRRADPEKIGIPDIFAFKDGCLIGIEVKSERGKQSVEQKAWEQKLKNAGAMYILARSWDDVEKLLIRS